MKNKKETKMEGRRKDGKLSGDHALSQSEASIKHPENLPGSYHPYERDNEQWKQYGRKTDGGLDENKRGDEKQKREEDGRNEDGRMGIWVETMPSVKVKQALSIHENSMEGRKADGGLDGKLSGDTVQRKNFLLGVDPSKYG
jgi:hypothetical protein